MKLFLKLAGILLVLAAVAGLVGFYVHGSRAPGAADVTDRVLLLVPDGASESDPMVHLWLDAGNELGLHMALLHDSELVSPTADVRCAGMIVPDQVHRSANDAVIGALYRFVHNGGQVMIVYDAATWDLNGRYQRNESRLSSLVGVHYALYDQFRANSILWSAVRGTAEAMDGLEIPPGKFIPLSRRNDKISWEPVSAGAKKDAEYTFSRYQFGELTYPSFRTTGDYDGKVLLESDAGLVAGYRKDAAGGVLFVNLPLGYLKDRTDGLLLHAFVRYFAERVLQLPFLAAVPDGVGGLVLNWHIDARFALAPLEELKKIGMFKQGPFSIHFTAGPDVDKFGDHKGLDVLHDPLADQWIKFFVSRGYTVGSHGGWMHNYWGAKVTDDNAAEFEPYLEKNEKALEQISGEPVREYSAPVGNHPRWVTHWLEKHGFVAYYYVGDAGMAPTRVYLNGDRDTSIWAFPILHMGRQAAFEEMQFDNIPVETAKDWLLDVTSFVSHEHTARLVYSHPLGASRYTAALQAWLADTAELEKQNAFRWYTMTELANFLTRRDAVEWNLSSGGGDTVVLEATHPHSLEHFSWALPQSRYSQVKVVEGNGSVRAADGYWFVTAGRGTRIKVQMRLLSDQPRALEVAP